MRAVAVSYPGCWYWVDDGLNPIGSDPDTIEDQERAADYRAFDWNMIAQAAREAVQLAGEKWDPSIREVEVSLSNPRP